MAVARMNTRLQMNALPPLSADWPFRRDPLGLLAGWRAFRTYETLAALDDASLADRGLTRGDLPRAALAKIRRGA